VFFLSSKEKTFRMVWKIELGGKRSYLAGTAHFFPCSFKKSLTGLISNADTVLFEGPLDESNMNTVRVYGMEDGDAPSLYDALDGKTIEKINKELGSGTGNIDSSLMSSLHMFRSGKGNLFHSEIEGLKPWMAFLKIWSQYLQKRGWKYSVDLEALSVARQLGKNIHFLETIEEQIAALNGIPFERIVNFFREFNSWEKFSRQHVKCYLKGDIETMMGVTVEFPTRCESIIDKRDPVMFERMEHFIEKGNAMVFVGTTHIRGISRMLEGIGYKVSKCDV